MVVPGAKDNVRNFKEHFNRGNVEESLQIVKDLLSANNVGYDDGWIIHNIIYILKKVIHVFIFPVHESKVYTVHISFQAFYAFDHMNHDLMSDECGCKEKQEQREQEAKLVEEQQRREKQRLVSKVLI